MRRGIAVPIVSIVLAASACDDPAGPAPLPGRHELIAAHGLSLPRLIWATEDCDGTLDAGSITFAEAGTFELVLDETTDCSRAGGAIEQDSDTIRSTYLVDGREIELATVPALTRGRRTEAGVSIEFLLQGMLVPLRFRRESP